MSKKVPINVALDVEVVEMLDTLGKIEDRKRASMLRIILTEGVRHRMSKLPPAARRGVGCETPRRHVRRGVAA